MPTIVCYTCNGSGERPPGTTCPTCDGSGEVEAEGTHPVTLAYVAATNERVNEIETKIDAIALQVQALFDDLNQ